MTTPALTMNAWLRWDIIGPRVERIDPATVLEFGAGLGAVAARLAEGRTYRGVEPDERSRSVAAARLSGDARVVAATDELDRDEFDLVAAFEVLEHVPDDEAELRRWAGYARPGGHVILSVPAGPDRFGAHDARVGHLRRYSPASLEAVADGAGLVDIETIPFGFPLGLALEAARNRMARRTDGEPNTDPAERTAASARIAQPPAWAGAATAAVTWPFRVMQRAAGGRGTATGLVLVARRP